MRKGADCLSKWVGEAERQLRLLFEQARRHQVRLCCTYPSVMPPVRMYENIKSIWVFEFEPGRPFH